MLDDNVDCDDIRSFFSDDAWIALEQVLAVKSRNAVWTCRECLYKIDNGQILIVCDSCLEWNHLTCVGLRKCPGSAACWKYAINFHNITGFPKYK